MINIKKMAKIINFFLISNLLEENVMYIVFSLIKEICCLKILNFENNQNINFNCFLNLILFLSLIKIIHTYLNQPLITNSHKINSCKFSCSF